MNEFSEDEGRLEPEFEPQRNIISWPLLLIISLLAALMPIAFYGWGNVYARYFEFRSPSIEKQEWPRGIGLAPSTIKFLVQDSDSGIHQIFVRSLQRGNSQELYSQKFPRGKKSHLVVIPLHTGDPEFEEGPVSIEISASDSSLWRNRSERNFRLSVDYRKPTIEVITKPEEIKSGSSGLVFFRAIDDDISLAGLKIGSANFGAHPASGIDKEFSDPALYVALITVPLEEVLEERMMRIFAEDRVGNAFSISVPFNLKTRESKNTKIELKDDFLRGELNTLADVNYKELQLNSQKLGEKVEYKSPAGSRERLLEKFSLVNSTLRQLNNDQLVARLNGPRFERMWNGSFVSQAGSLSLGFAEKVEYTYNGSSLGNGLMLGNEYTDHRRERDVFSANNGIVLFSENIGVFGRMLAIDHGLGLVSVYAHLESVHVAHGQQVQKGQLVGRAGTSGFSRAPNLYYELRLQGHPVNPLEWNDNLWYLNQITARIEQTKRSLGMQVFRVLER